MDHKLHSVAGQAIYSLRKTVVQPVFRQIKGAGRLDRFRLCGLEKVNGEWALMATSLNILKLFRASLATVCRSPPRLSGLDRTSPSHQHSQA